MMIICYSMFIHNMCMELDTDMGTDMERISFIIMLLLVRTVEVEVITLMFMFSMRIIIMVVSVK